MASKAFAWGVVYGAGMFGWMDERVGREGVEVLCAIVSVGCWMLRAGFGVETFESGDEEKGGLSARSVLAQGLSKSHCAYNVNTDMYTIDE